MLTDNDLLDIELRNNKKKDADIEKLLEEVRALAAAVVQIHDIVYAIGSGDENESAISDIREITSAVV